MLQGNIKIPVFSEYSKKMTLSIVIKRAYLCPSLPSQYSAHHLTFVIVFTEIGAQSLIHL